MKEEHLMRRIKQDLLAKTIRTKREKLSLSQSDLSEITHINRAMISKIENGAVVPAIAVGNLTYVLMIALVIKLLKNAKLPEIVRNILAVAAGAVCKFIIQYLLIVKWIAPAFLPPKAQPVMAVNFGVMQLFTACIGGVLACLIGPVVKKGVKN